MADLCVGLRGVDSLRHELDRARENLRDTDANIEKLTGRPAFQNRSFPRRPPLSRPGADEPYSRGGPGALFSLAGYDAGGPPPPKRAAGAFSRLGLPIAGQRPFAPRRNRDEEEEDELPHKPAIHSSVIATPKDTMSREDAIAAQQSGAGGKAGTARNRRMFGLLLGTLVKFQEDEKTRGQQVTEKRKAVEQRLEEKQREEQDRLKRERQQLFVDRRRHQAKLRALEQKMELVEIHEAWEAETHNLEYFIRTDARPHLFFLPKSHVPESLAKLEESKRVLRGIVTDRRKQLEEEIEEIMSKEQHSKDQDAMEDEDASENDGNEETMAESEKADTGKTQRQKVTAADVEPESDLEDENDGMDYGLSADSATAEVVQKLAKEMLPASQDTETTGPPDQVSETENVAGKEKQSEEESETAEKPVSGNVDAEDSGGGGDTNEDNRTSKTDNSKEHKSRRDKDKEVEGRGDAKRSKHSRHDHDDDEKSHKRRESSKGRRHRKKSKSRDREKERRRHHSGSRHRRDSDKHRREESDRSRTDKHKEAKEKHRSKDDSHEKPKEAASDAESSASDRH